MPRGIWLRWFRLQTIFTRRSRWCSCLCCCCCCCCHILRWQSSPGHQDNGLWGCGGVAGSRGQRQRQPIDIDSYSRECIYTRAQICGTEVSRWREVTGLVQSGCHCHPPPIQLWPPFGAQNCQRCCCQSQNCAWVPWPICELGPPRNGGWFG